MRPFVLRLIARARAIFSGPLGWILVGVLLLDVVGIGWGLPASDGWDNDGVAPRDFLVAVSELFSRGPSFDSAYLHYAPVHTTLLALLTAPISLTALAHAPSLAPSDVVHEMVKVPYMTAIAFVARAVAVVMSAGIVLAMAKIGEEIAGRRAGFLVAAVAGVNTVMTYYAHTSCLDVPALFWGSFALLALVRAVARQEPRRARTFAVLAALSLGSKDQEAALFLLTAPLTLGVWMWLDPWVRAHRRTVLREAAIACGIAVGMFLVVDGVILNPTGFRARLHFLLGSASQDFAYYSKDTLGRLLVIRDSFARFDRYYPLVFAPLALVGLLRLRWISDRSRRLAALVPLFAAISFTLMFNCSARRTEDRFVLPQMTLWSVYMGLGLEWALFAPGPRWRKAALSLAAAAAFSWAIFRCAAVDANLVLDPRYDTEAWLEAHVADGDTVEVHGLNVYLPRLPSRTRDVRVGPEPVKGRNPIPGLIEEQDLYGNIAARAPRWIVVSEGFAGRYLLDTSAAGNEGRVFAETQLENGADVDATSFFRRLVRGELGYRMVHASTWTSTFWPEVDIHAAVSRPVWIFERTP